MSSETHNPRQGETYTVTAISKDEAHHTHQIDGVRNGQEVHGQLTIYLDGGDFNGYDWVGPDLDDDQLQDILDLFAADF